MLKKKDLLELGLSEEVAEKVLTLSSDDIKESYITKERFNEVIEERNGLRTQLKERDSQLEDLQSATTDVDGLKAKISELQDINKNAEKNHAKEIKSLKVNNAIDNAITANKGKNATAIKAVLNFDVDKAEFNDDGSVKGLNDLFKELVSNEATSFLFEKEQAPQVQGATPVTTSDTVKSKSLNEMSYTELCAYVEKGGTLE